MSANEVGFVVSIVLLAAVFVVVLLVTVGKPLPTAAAEPDYLYDEQMVEWWDNLPDDQKQMHTEGLLSDLDEETVDLIVEHFLANPWALRSLLLDLAERRHR